MAAHRGHLELRVDPQARGHFSRQPVKPQRNAALVTGARLQTPQQINSPDSTGPLSTAGHASVTHCESECGTRPDTSAVTFKPKANLVLRTDAKERAGHLLYQNTNQSNHGLTRSVRRHPAEERTAQKILSGLKLRRSNSRKGEQLHFV